MSLTQGFAGLGEGEEIKEISLSLLDLPPYQPRAYFDEIALTELATSIREHGVIQPVLVRPKLGGRYELLAGGRRYRACQAIDRATIPAIVRELDDRQALTATVTENLLREDLNPVEETEGILKLIALRLNLDEADISPLLHAVRNQRQGRKISRSIDDGLIAELDTLFGELGRMTLETFAAHRLPLLNLPPDVLTALRRGQLAYTKAMAIARVEDAAARAALLESAIGDRLSLSEIRLQVKALHSPPSDVDGRELKQRFERLTAKAKRSQLWTNRDRRVQVEELLSNLERLLEGGG
ncbi:MAG: ParB/RepB/Spo0J family partition protein [Coleofasciculaceae cyanobacterium RL_1_1]|nr:ParB/RepB/Spo0J family partition protein [Coleofasciculaceae cyanobacterium RL_1_1]